MNFQLEVGDCVRVETVTANPFWRWTGVVEEKHVIDGEPFYCIKSGFFLLTFHETWLRKID